MRSLWPGNRDELTLLWVCRECGWTLAVNAPGFAGDGQYHYPDGRTQCGPIHAQGVKAGAGRPPMQDAELHAACEAYLRANEWAFQSYAPGWWNARSGERRLTLGEALDVQWARDGVDVTR